MGNLYRPERWVIVKMLTSDPHYRVFGTFGGSYTEGESWRLNSGITKVEDHGEYLHFYGDTGSVYICQKGMYGVKLYGSAVLDNIRRQLVEAGFNLDILDHETDFLNMYYDLTKVSKTSADKLVWR